jgi:hypothetical protein
MSDKPHRPVSRPLESVGVHAALNHVRDEAVAKMLAWLGDEIAAGRLDGLSADQRDAIAHHVGVIARQGAANGVGEAWQSAVNRSVADEEHERDTLRSVAPLCPTCGQAMPTDG